jgi:hypothetical protein
MYYATLRQKQGERRALKQLEEFGSDTSKFIPNIIIKDADQDSLDEIRGSYSGFALLDVRDFETEDIVVLEELLEESQNTDFEILYPVEYILNNNGKENKKYVRIEDSVVNPFFISWLKENQSTLPSVVMLDFEFIDSGVSPKLTKFKPVLQSLNNHEVIIMSGAVPQTLPVTSEENYLLRRFEKDIYNAAKEIAPENSKIHFGDYTSVSPILATGGRAIVQLKYTLEDDYWFVRNGLRRGNYDFVAVCNQITDLEDFDELSCWGDSYIKSVVDDNTNKGNPSVWTSVGINKHIVVCLNEI